MDRCKLPRWERKRCAHACNVCIAFDSRIVQPIDWPTNLQLYFLEFSEPHRRSEIYREHNNKLIAMFCNAAIFWTMNSKTTAAAAEKSNKYTRRNNKFAFHVRRAGRQAIGFEKTHAIMRAICAHLLTRKTKRENRLQWNGKEEDDEKSN